ncbi:hypothetical protein B6259_05000 [Ruminococcaceae bacterium CPB6]|jgi:stage IV sporulation protein FB|uniref:Peptidase M50 n=1 Tax=Caproicibacterium lactatifermentans TaxID=2666138 RepID=A0A859DR64_9FIRM|nr:hypothetical protein B6259_05000 [Ruminococcaceae bacterium CPB6]QKN23989.1 peptidase M50 [Caproicibacterium lactatifermentans]QKO30940.1 peptidase M50 [Caproicibacterium lactatifermentans]
MIFFTGNCRVETTVPFFALMAFLLLADRTGAALCGLCAAALHEGGHLLAMHLCGRAPIKIRFTALGAEISAEGGTESYLEDAFIAAAGPLVNLLLYLLLLLCRILAPVSPAVQLFALANIVLAVFNLLPVQPLDGGQALLSLLSCHCKRETSYRIVQICSFMTLVPIGVAGFLLLFRSHWNVTLLLADIYLFILLLMKPERFGQA